MGLIRFERLILVWIKMDDGGRPPEDPFRGAPVKPDPQQDQNPQNQQQEARHEVFGDPTVGGE